MYLAKASLDSLQDLVPARVRGSKNVDLLPIVFNICVAGLVNKNNDVLEPKTAIEIYKQFIDRPINIAHDRNVIVGHVVGANFSEFGTDKPLTEDDVKGLDVFNIALAGVIYRVSSNDLAEYIEEASDPNSPNYLSIHASWEVGFENYKIIKGSKNYAESEIVSDENFEEYDKYLKQNKGNGFDKDGVPVYRLITTEAGYVLPLGAAKTFKPAGDVRGVFAVTSENEDHQKDKEEIERVIKKKEEPELQAVAEEKESLDKIKEKQKNIAHSEKNNVKQITKDMNIKSVKDITEKWSDLQKQESAASIVDFVVKELENKSEKFFSEVKEKEDVLVNVKAEMQTAKAEVEKLTKEVEGLKEAFAEKQAIETELGETKKELENFKLALATLEAEKAEKENEEAFNARMESLESEYKFDDEMSQVVASEINGLDNETFAVWKKKFDIYNKSNKKTAVASTKDDEDTKIKQAFASVKQTTETPPNRSTEPNKDIKKLYADALAGENVTIA